LLASAPIGVATISGDLTLQSVDLTDTEAGITNRPENLPEVFGRIRGRVPLPLGLIGGADAMYSGSQFCIDPGTGRDTRLDAGTIFGTEVYRNWTVRQAGLLSHLQTRVAVDNLANTALYDQCGLPRPGRLLRIEFRLF